MSHPRIEGRVAVITGASSGIGRATALRLAELGMHVVVAARREDRLEALVGEIEAAHSEGEASWVPTDLRQEGDIAALARHTQDRHGRIDVLVNNAGLGYVAPVAEIDAGKLDEVLAVNFRGAVLCVKHFFPIMKVQRSGLVVNMGSVSSRRGFPTGTPYVASKFALRGFSQCLAKEGAQHNVRVLDLYPDFVDSEFFDTMGLQFPGSGKGIPATAVAEVIAQTLLLPDSAHIREVEIQPPHLRLGP